MLTGTFWGVPPKKEAPGKTGGLALTANGGKPARLGIKCKQATKRGAGNAKKICDITRRGQEKVHEL